jgi:hypothetical protein
MYFISPPSFINTLAMTYGIESSRAWRKSHWDLLIKKGIESALAMPRLVVLASQ